MSELLEKCAVCFALLDEEDLFCANCGREAPDRQRDLAVAKPLHSTCNFLCESCGASMSYDASAQSLRCPFCGSTRLEARQDAQVLAPSRVLPFQVTRDSAQSILRKWLGSSFWYPSDLARSAIVESMQAVYVPYWLFSARTFTFWTADTNKTPFGARGNWYPLSGEHRGKYEGVMVGASSVLTPAETHAICPFDMRHAVRPDQVDLENAVYEQFRVQRKYARPLAQAGLESLERAACQQYVPGTARNLKVNVRLDGLHSEPVLLPVWIMAYRYQDKVFRFLVNGQSGAATGTAPIDWKKQLLVAGLIGLGVIILLGLIAAVAGG